MKIALAICMTLIIITVSCKKSNDQANTVPVVTDPVKPPLVKPDTSTLLKSCWTYNYDAAGNITDDSIHNQWIFDDQRRIVQTASEGNDYSDTLTYTYLNDRYMMNENSYYNGSLVLATNIVYYQHVRNHTDSILSKSAGYGVQAGYLPDGATYYYYNQTNQDSVEKTYSIDHGIVSFRSSLNYYYTGANLDSTVFRDGNGKIMYVEYFSQGDPLSESNYLNDVVAGTITFTYSNIPTAGLFVMYRTSKLMSGYTSVAMPSTINLIETDSYLVDSANRVTDMLIYRNSSTLSQKQVFTYY